MNEVEWQRVFRAKELIWAALIIVGTTVSVTAIGVTFVLGLAEKSYVDGLAKCVEAGFGPHDLHMLHPRNVYENLDFELAEGTVAKNVNTPMTLLKMIDTIASANISFSQNESSTIFSRCWKKIQ